MRSPHFGRQRDKKAQILAGLLDKETDSFVISLKA
jgi:hypothetical protein